MYVHALKIVLGEQHLGFPPFSKKLKKQISLSAYFFYLMYYCWLLGHIFISMINLCGKYRGTYCLS